MFKHKNQKMKDSLTANWLIGDGCISEDFKRMVKVRKFGFWDALRSMKDPGTAYSVTNKGITNSDQQPAHMRDFVYLAFDNEHDFGGVHYNSGIPNKAFYLFAVKVGGPSWQIPGKVWYHTIEEATFGTLDERTDEREASIEEFADATLKAVQQLFPDQREKLAQAWLQVGVPVT